MNDDIPDLDLHPEFRKGVAFATACAEEEIARLRAGIEAYLTGDYPTPRDHRPNGCAHGRPYYEECGHCDVEHLQAVLDGLWKPA